MSFFGDLAFGAIKGIVDPIASIFNKKTDAAVEKYKVDGVYNVEAMKQDTEIIRARVDLAKAMKDDPTTKMGRRFFIYPVGVWFTAIVVDSLLHKALEYTYRVEALPTNLEYIPYAVIAYLFVSAWKK
jgi:hypothetical protein